MSEAKPESIRVELVERARGHLDTYGDAELDVAVGSTLRDELERLMPEPAWERKP